MMDNRMPNNPDRLRDERIAALESALQASEARCRELEKERDAANELKARYDKWLSNGVYFTDEEYRKECEKNRATDDRLTAAEKVIEQAEEALKSIHNAHDVLSDGLQADLENGVKFLNEGAATKFKDEYPKTNQGLCELLVPILECDEALSAISAWRGKEIDKL